MVLVNNLVKIGISLSLFLFAGNLRADIYIENKCVYIIGERFIPDSITNNTSLDSMIFREYPIENFPKEILSMKLLYVDFSGCRKLKDLEGIDSMRYLKGLVLSETGILEIPSSVYELKDLNLLDISKTKVRQLSLEIQNLENLVVLRINNTEIKEFPVFLCRLMQMSECWIINTEIRNIPDEIVQLTNLKFFWVYWDTIVNGDTIKKRLLNNNPDIVFSHSPFVSGK
jgi:hypothetical protein